MEKFKARLLRFASQLLIGFIPLPFIPLPSSAFIGEIGG
jgi:hypothetical protein